MKQEIRIIGGTYRGKKINFPVVDGLRPTPDRVKETLFNWLMHRVRDSSCLDLFAGSGGLGLEAFSRGAQKVTFIEQSVTAYAHLQKTLQQFNSPKLQLKKHDALSYLQHCSNQFDLIFLDPPFAHDLIPQCLYWIEQKALLNKNGLVYFESSKPLDLDDTVWSPIKIKQSGQVVYGLLSYIS